ncbi:MAG: hypothetical protein HY070_01400 [Chloroflexi bacterium]|nr:hypothetical protein [Chloroflexota bacterium]
MHLASRYPLHTLVAKVALTEFGRLNNYSLEALIDFGLSILIPFCLYLCAWQVVRHAPSDRKLLGLIFGFAILFAATLVAMYPIGATDLFNYVFYSRILVHYGQNPLSVPPRVFNSDPFYSRVLWYNTPAPYGPLWVLLTIPGTLIAGDDLTLNLFLMNILPAIFYLGCAVLILVILRQSEPKHMLTGTFLFAWNPLILFEAPGNGHNGIIMMFFVLVAVYLLLKRRWAWVLPALVASVLVKYISAILLAPFLIYCLSKQEGVENKIRFLFKTLALSAILSALVMARFVSMPTGLADEANWFSLLAVPTLGLNLLNAVLGERGANTLVLILCSSAYLLLYVTSLRLSTYRDHVHNLVLLSTWLTMTYLIIACVAFQPWFIIWSIALGIWVNHVVLRRVLLVFTISGLMSYAASFFWVWNWNHWQRIHANAMFVAVIFLPPLFVWLGSLLGSLWTMRPNRAILFSR